MKRPKPEPMKINAKQLIRILRMADKNTTLNKVTRLHIERERLKQNRAKMNQKLKELNAELKQTTEVPAMEQFTFRF
jgi:hypothetical protein